MPQCLTVDMIIATVTFDQQGEHLSVSSKSDVTGSAAAHAFTVKEVVGRAIMQIARRSMKDKYVSVETSLFFDCLDDGCIIV